MVYTKFSSILALTAAANALALASLSSPVAAAPRVDPAVHRTLRQQTTVNLIVTLKDGTASPLNAVQEASFETRGDKIQALVDRLQRHAATSQSEVTKMVAQESGGTTPLFIEATSFWISNQLFFKDATLELVEKLAGLSSVGEIQEAARIPIASAASTATTLNTTATASIEWGIKKVQAPEVCANGYTGQGVVVGGIDSGVRGTHEILRNNWRKDHGWFDGLKKQAEPYDEGGHGSLTLGFAVGSNGFGVAPGATWIACKPCDEEFCTQEALLACGQFMLCPTEPDGQNADCSKAPHVINNSWASTSGTFYQDVIAAWVAAGIIPIYAVGNYGFSGCSTVYSPYDYPNVIGVGATNIDDNAMTPTTWGYSPRCRSHRVGAISQQEPDVFAGTRYSHHNNCAVADTAGEWVHVWRTPDTTYPNNQYGYGRVDALAATLKAAAMK